MAACACDRLWELFDSISVPCGHLERGAAAHGHWGWCQFQRPLETAWQGSGSPVTLPCAEVGVEWETDHTMGELSGGITGLAGSCHSPFWCAQLQQRGCQCPLGQGAVRRGDFAGPAGLKCP